MNHPLKGVIAMNKKQSTFITIVITALVLFVGLYSFNFGFRRTVNNWFSDRELVDQDTTYENRKKVEDTARSLITNYSASKSEYETYKQYIGTDDKAKEQRALDARTSANMSVSKYNNYLTENKYLFKNNLPNDIPLKLEKVGE